MYLTTTKKRKKEKESISHNSIRIHCLYLYLYIYRQQYKVKLLRKLDKFFFLTNILVDKLLFDNIKKSKNKTLSIYSFFVVTDKT